MATAGNKPVIGVTVVSRSDLAAEVLGLRPLMFTRTVRQRWTTRWVGESTDCGLQGFETVGYNHPIWVSVGSFQTLPNVSFGELA